MACFRHLVPLDFGRDRRTASDPQVAVQSAGSATHFQTWILRWVYRCQRQEDRLSEAGRLLYLKMQRF